MTVEKRSEVKTDGGRTDGARFWGGGGAVTRRRQRQLGGGARGILGEGGGVTPGNFEPERDRGGGTFMVLFLRGCYKKTLLF